MSYVTSKLYLAIYTLATHEGNARERLYSARKYFSLLSEEDFPAKYRSDWSWVTKQFFKKGAEFDGERQVRSSLQATRHSMRNRTASKIAKKIADIYFNLDDVTR